MRELRRLSQGRAGWWQQGVLKAAQSRQDLLKGGLDITAKAALDTGDMLRIKHRSWLSGLTWSQTVVRLACMRGQQTDIAAPACAPVSEGIHCPDVSSDCQLPHQEP